MNKAPARTVWYGVFWALIALYYMAARLVGLNPRQQLLASWRGSLILMAGLGAIFLLAICIWTLFERPRSMKEILSVLRERIWNVGTVERLLGIFILSAGVNVMFDVFAAFKPAIPNFHPYTWDPFLAGLDEWLHLGTPPWEWLHALPGKDLLTTILDHVYVQWYSVTALVVLLVLTAAPLTLRLRFFLGFVVVWILGGTVLGTLLASGGPVYYEAFTEDASRFASLLDYLDGAAPIARELQQRLWDAYLTPGDAFAFEGISAMPSLHVAVAAYFAAWAWRMDRVWGMVFTLYAFVIFLGSVALGWHYAVDGYAGLLIALAVQRASEWLVCMPGSAAGSNAHNLEPISSPSRDHLR